LSQIHQSQAVELALQALDRPQDTNLDYALWLTVRELLPEWLPVFQEGRLDFHGNTRHLAFALQAAGTQAPLRPLVEFLKCGKSHQGRDNFLALMAELGGPDELKMLFNEMLSPGKQNEDIQASLLESLDQAALQRGVRPTGDLNKLEVLLKSENDSVQSSAARLAGRWKLEYLRPQLAKLAQAEKSSDLIRRAAIDGLVSLGGPQTLELLKQLVKSSQPTALRRPAIVAMANLDLKLAADYSADLLTPDKEPADPAGMFNAFLERRE